MLQLIGCEVKVPCATERALLKQQVLESRVPALVLDTCQRFEWYGPELPPVDSQYICQSWQAGQAFERLARIVAGVESRIPGELEVVGQVRSAYKQFHGAYGRNLTALDRFFQEALALGRKARRRSGIDREMTSLSGLAARQVLDATPPDSPVVVVGSGSLASSAARYIVKRGSRPIRIMSRCPERAASLALQVGGFGTGLDQLAHQLDGAVGIVCATAAPHPVLYPHHLHQPDQVRTIIDLGEPPDCHEDVRSMPGIHYLGLLDIEAKANVNTAFRHQAAEKAEQIIRDGAAAWSRKN